MEHSHGWGRIVAASVTSVIAGMGSRLLDFATNTEVITLVSAWIGICTGMLTTTLLWFKIRNEMKETRSGK